MKIAMLGQKAVPSRKGGIERVVTILAPMFVEAGCEVTCYSRRGAYEENEYGAGPSARSYRGVRLRQVPSGRTAGGRAAVIASFWASLCAAIGDYDLVHYHGEGYCAMMWLPRLYGKRCVVTVHGLDWQRDKWGSGLGAKYIRLGEKALVKMADEVIVLSENMQRYFRDTYGRDTVFIPNGVGEARRRPARLLRQRYGLDQDSYFCTVVRLTEEKGVHWLIEAYRRIHTDKKLLIVGESSSSDAYDARLMELAAGDPNIRFTGFVEGELLEEIYSNAYAFVLASNLEGMPLSLLEAMSYGNCVVGSDIPEIREVAEDHGILFEAGNVAALAEKLQMLSDSPELVGRHREGTAEYVRDRYSWDRTARQTMELYGSCLGRGGGKKHHNWQRRGNSHGKSNETTQKETV